MYFIIIPNSPFNSSCALKKALVVRVFRSAPVHDSVAFDRLKLTN